MTTKRCFKCLCEKPLDAFYTHGAMGDGRLGKCKECTRADVRANRLAKIDHYRAFDKSRASMPHRVAARKEYAQTPEGKRAYQRAHKASTLRYPDRNKARTTLGNAVRDGRVIPWPVCAIPECSGKPHGHHPDYSRPLDVVWLCDKHHKEAHALARKAA